MLPARRTRVRSVDSTRGNAAAAGGRNARGGGGAGASVTVGAGMGRTAVRATGARGCPPGAASCAGRRGPRPISSASAATRAAERARSSRISRAAYSSTAAVVPSETSVTSTSAPSMMTSPNLEFHGNFDENVDRHAVPCRRREPPLAHGRRRARVEPVAEALQQPHASHRSVAIDDDLHDDVTFDLARARLFCVVGLHLAEQDGRRDTAPRAIGPAPRAAARPFADATPLAFTDAGAVTRADAAVGSGTTAVVARRRFLEHASAVARVGRNRDDRRLHW